jgi:glycosyltransferase involved in cell wall biosynthesis
MNQDKKISIITICKNSEKTISKCIESVIWQTYSNIEYIIIDGASTDNTLNIIDKYKNEVSKLISEPDQGIYDAMNKGIDVSMGEYIIFCNADDYLISDHSIDCVMQLINANANYDYDIFYGNVFILNNEKCKGNIWKAANVSKYSLFRGSIPHPATIYSRDAFKRCGLFDISYTIAGDYEWIVRAYLQNKLNFKSIDTIVTVFLKGGISTDLRFNKISKNEIIRIRNNYFNYSERKYYQFRWFFRKNFKFW